MTGILGAAAFLLLPGLLLLRERPWLALPASAAFWIVSWNLVAGAGIDRTTVLHLALYAAGSLLVVAMPRLDRARLLLAGGVLAACAALHAASTVLPEPHVAGRRDVVAARLLSWRDGVPVGWAPLATHPVPPWPTGVSGPIADLLLLGLPAPAAVGAVLGLSLALPLAATWGRGRRALGAATALCAASLVLDGGRLAIAAGLALAGGRLLDDHPRRWPGLFGAAVSWAAALLVHPLGVLAALPVALRHPSRACRAGAAALLLSLPLVRGLASPRSAPDAGREHTSVYTVIREPR
jgi:hypothetical protein